MSSVIGFSTNNKKNVPTTTNSTTTQPVSEEMTTAAVTETSTILPVVTTTKPSATRRIPETNNSGTTSQKSAEQLEAEYQEEYNALISERDSQVAELQRSLDRLEPPKALSENPTEEEIAIYNQVKESYEKEYNRRQKWIDGEYKMCDGEIERLKARYGK